MGGRDSGHCNGLDGGSKGQLGLQAQHSNVVGFCVSVVALVRLEGSHLDQDAAIGPLVRAGSDLENGGRDWGLQAMGGGHYEVVADDGASTGMSARLLH